MNKNIKKFYSAIFTNIYQEENRKLLKILEKLIYFIYIKSRHMYNKFFHQIVYILK